MHDARGTLHQVKLWVGFTSMTSISPRRMLSMGSKLATLYCEMGFEMPVLHHIFACGLSIARPWFTSGTHLSWAWIRHIASRSRVKWNFWNGMFHEQCWRQLLENGSNTAVRPEDWCKKTGRLVHCFFFFCGKKETKYALLPDQIKTLLFFLFYAWVIEATAKWH